MRTARAWTSQHHQHIQPLQQHGVHRAGSHPRGCRKVSRKLGYAGNGQYQVSRDDTRRTTEYRLRLDRQTWQENRGSRPCVIIRPAPCLAMFGLGNASATTGTGAPAATRTQASPLPAVETQLGGRLPDWNHPGPAARR